MEDMEACQKLTRNIGVRHFLVKIFASCGDILGYTFLGFTSFLALNHIRIDPHFSFIRISRSGKSQPLSSSRGSCRHDESATCHPAISTEQLLQLLQTKSLTCICRCIHTIYPYFSSYHSHDYRICTLHNVYLKICIHMFISRQYLDIFGI